MSPWIDQSDSGRKHDERGDVMCEVCEAWVSEYVRTLDGVYLCMKCAPTPAEAQAEMDQLTPEDLAEFYDENEIAGILRDRMKRRSPPGGQP
jgi:hypothetical protein